MTTIITTSEYLVTFQKTYNNEAHNTTDNFVIQGDPNKGLGVLKFAKRIISSLLKPAFVFRANKTFHYQWIGLFLLFKVQLNNKFRFIKLIN